MIRAARAGSSDTGHPQMAAIRPKVEDSGLGPVQWELMFWPEPQDVYTVQIPYRRSLDLLTTAERYPICPVEHAETLREVCLWQAEVQTNDEQGVHAIRAMERFHASITFDRQMHTPDTIGYNGDPSVREGNIPWVRSWYGTYEGGVGS